MVDLTPSNAAAGTFEAPKETAQNFAGQGDQQLAAGMAKAGAGLEDLSVPFAEKAAQQAASQIQITRDADGTPQVTRPDNSAILGRAGDQYHRIVQAATVAKLQTAVDKDMIDLRAEHAGDPQGFQTAADAYSQRLLANKPPDLANALGSYTDNLAAQHYAGMVNAKTTTDTNAASADIDAKIQSQRNELNALARQGGTDTPEFRAGAQRLDGFYDKYGSNPMFGKSPDWIAAQKRSERDRLFAEGTVGEVDRTWQKDGKAKAQEMLRRSILDNPKLDLTDAERSKIYSWGMARLGFLDGDRKEEIDAHRQAVAGILDLAHSGKTPPDAMWDQTIDKARTLGDTESVHRLEAARQFVRGVPPTLTPQQMTSGIPQPGDGRIPDVISGGAPRLAGSAPGVNPVLPDVLSRASAALPEGYTAKIVSGMREGDPREHGKGNAVDVQIIGPDGKPLDNYQNAQTFRVYEQFAQAARHAQMESNPEAADQFRWGGYFSGPKGKYGALDLMHFDLGGGNGLGMAGGSWEKGLTDAQRALFPGAQSQGIGERPAALGPSGQPRPPVSTNGAPFTPDQLKANPFLMSEWARQVSRDAGNQITYGQQIGTAIETGLKAGQSPSPLNLAAFMQLAQAHPDKLGEQMDRIGAQIEGDQIADTAARQGPAGKALIDQAMQLSQGASFHEQAVARAAQDHYARAMTQYNEDPVAFGQRSGFISRQPVPIDPGNPATVAQAMTERAEVSRIIAARTGTEPKSAAFAPDKSVIQNIATSGDPKAKLALLSSIAGMPDGVREATLKDLFESGQTKTLAIAGSLARDNPDAARDILAGQTALAAEPRLEPKDKQLVPEMWKMMPPGDFKPGVRDSLGQAITAAYAKASADAGDVSQTLNRERLQKATDDVTGGILQFRGSRIVAPWYGATNEQFTRALQSVTPDDLRGAMTTDGTPFPATALQTRTLGAASGNWRLESAGDGKYRIFSGDDKSRRYVMTDRLDARDPGGPFVLDLGAKKTEIQAQPGKIVSPWSYMPPRASVPPAMGEQPPSFNPMNLQLDPSRMVR